MNRFPDRPVAQGKALLLFVSVKGNEDLQHFTSYSLWGGGKCQNFKSPRWESFSIFNYELVCKWSKVTLAAVVNCNAPKKLPLIA